MVGGIAWIKWLMMLTGESLTLSPVVFFGGNTAYKSLAKWLGVCGGGGKAPRPLLLGDSSSPGVARSFRGDRGIRYREVLRDLNHAES